MFRNLLNRLERLRPRFGGGAADTAENFGTFRGVFVPTVLTILGAIMYLREGWVIGNAGLVGGILIILLAHVITITTALSVASIATNIRVGDGGAFSIISESLGLEIGGSVGVPLYLAQAVSITLYVLAFTEGWRRIFPDHPQAIVSLTVLVIVFVIAFISAKAASQTQVLVLMVVLFSLVSILLGAFPIGESQGLTEQPQLWGDFPSAGFFGVFAVFFPAITGIMVGINMSGTLEDPRESIPKGTFWAIGFTLTVYLLLAYWLSRVATPQELVENTTIMVDEALWGWAVLAGLLGATFSSALGSFVAAPRVMQALARYRVLPFSKHLIHETETAEPRPAIVATGVVALLALGLALATNGLNTIAGLITMFFLLTYAVLNGTVVVEQWMSMVSFRPTFHVPRAVPIVGLLFCVFVMFLVNPIFSLVAIAVTTVTYIYLSRRHLEAPFVDVRSGLFLAVADWAAKALEEMPDAPERTWRPNILAPVRTSKLLQGSYRLLQATASPRGAIYALGIYAPGEREKVEGLEALSHAFSNDGIYSRYALVEDAEFVAGARAALQVLQGAFFEPNLLFLSLERDAGEARTAEIEQLLRSAAELGVGVLLLARDPVAELGREQSINVWLTPQGPEWELSLRLANLDLLVLTAYQLWQSWEGEIRLCMAVAEDEQVEPALDYLTTLIRRARLPESARCIVRAGDFDQVLRQNDVADLNVFGLSQDADLCRVKKTVEIVNGTCLFTRDSGKESALA